MKAKFRLSKDLSNVRIFPGEPNPPLEILPWLGKVEFDLDETYWRMEFAKVCLKNIMDGWENTVKKILDQGLEIKGEPMENICKLAFNIADAMLTEAKKRNGKT